MTRPARSADRLTLTEEAALARRIEAGVLARALRAGEWAMEHGPAPADLDALERDGVRAHEVLVSSNLGLVWLVVRPIAARSGLERAELFQEGMVGLLEAIPRFDPTRGSFATCALPWVRMRVWEAAATALGSLGLPPGRAKAWRQVRALEASLTSELGRVPDPGEVAAACGRSEGSVRALLAYEPVGHLGDVEPADRSEPPAPVGSDAVSVRRLLRRLDAFDRAILAHRFGLGGRASRTCGEVAALLGRSEATIRRRERAALALLRAGSDPGMVA